MRSPIEVLGKLGRANGHRSRLADRPWGMLVRYTARGQLYGALERPQIVDNSSISVERIVAVACRYMARKTALLRKATFCPTHTKKGAAKQATPKISNN